MNSYPDTDSLSPLILADWDFCGTRKWSNLTCANFCMGLCRRAPARQGKRNLKDGSIVGVERVRRGHGGRKSEGARSWRHRGTSEECSQDVNTGAVRSGSIFEHQRDGTPALGKATCRGTMKPHPARYASRWELVMATPRKRAPQKKAAPRATRQALPRMLPPYERRARQAAQAEGQGRSGDCRLDGGSMLVGAVLLMVLSAVSRRG